MADIGAALSTELTRIIDCPYPASLSGLALILGRVDTSTIRVCIHNRPPCAVSRLAALVCEALPLWAYTLRVLQCLCHAPEFRHELLLLKPGLLNDLLTKANSSQQDFENYVELCVLLLSRPLPDSVSLPAAAQPFFLRVFDRATRNPHVITLKPVYSLLNGACRQLLNLLPPDAQEHFERELCRILSSIGAGKNSMLLLWCIGIVALAEHPKGIDDLQTLQCAFEQPISSESLEMQWKTTSGEKLFGSTEKIYKTITLTYMNVVWATKGDADVSDDDVVEGIRIVIRTLRFVDRGVRESWPKSSALARGTFPKLREKMMRTGINKAILLEALCFYAMIAGQENLPQDIVTQYGQCLAECAQMADSNCLSETLATSLPLFAPHMQESSLRTLLAGILDACISAPSRQQLANLLTLVDKLTSVIPSCDLLQTKTLSVLSTNNLHGKLWSFVQARPINEDHGCQTYAVSLHQKLISATIALLLTLALAAQPKSSSLPYDLAINLINKQRELPSVPSSCSHPSETAERPPISLFQQKSTPYTGQHLQDWRNRLKSELESQSFYQRDSIVRSVAQICQDLESRCNTVEEPLRKEQERSTELEQRVSRLSEHVSSLETQAVDATLHREGLEKEMDSLEDEKLRLINEKVRADADLKEMKDKLDEANRKADEAQRTIEEDLNAKELEFRSIVLRNEEKLHARDTELEELNGALTHLKDARARQGEEHGTLNEQYKHLQVRLRDTEQKLENESKNASRQADQITRLESREFDLESQLQGTETELEITIGKLSDLEVSFQESVRSSEEVLRETEAKYSNDLESAAAKAEEERDGLSNQLRTALQNSQRIKDAHDETRRDLQLLQDSVPSLETRVQELTDLCSEQEEELDELRTLRRNVLASMGLPSQKPLKIRSTPRSHNEILDSHILPEAQDHRRRKSAICARDAVPKATMGTQGITNTAMENIADASFASSDSQSSQGGGSSPKRAKPRPSLKVPTVHTPFTQKPVLTSRLVSKKFSPSKRSALRQLSPNRRHTTVGFAISEMEEEHLANKTRSVRKRRGSLQDIEQEDLDMDDFIAGTPLTPGSFMTGTGRVPEEDDGTTTEL